MLLTVILFKTEEFQMRNKKLSILVVDDDELYRLALKQMLSPFGDIADANNLSSGLKLLKDRKFDLAFLDMTLDSELEGLDMVKAASDQGIYSVVLSGHDSDEIIERAYKAGCQDYFQKGDEEESIKEVINKYLLNQNKFEFDAFIKNDFITQDQETIDDLELAFNNSSSKIPIFISGETGTGKTMLAKLIHKASKRKGKFIEINCSEINPNLIESELFGHVKGAFTGASNAKIGRLKQAHEGTLFIDEICSMPISIQVKLLKVLEDKSFYPVGSESLTYSNFRIITASQKEILKKIKNEEFRADLYHRISGININLKPLTDRKNDIPLIAKKRMSGNRRIVIKKDAMNMLKNYSWPGNVRELLTTIDLLKSRDRGIISSVDLPMEIVTNSPIIHSDKILTATQYNFAMDHGLNKLIEIIETEVLSQTLKDNNNAVRSTMKNLNISNRKFYHIKERARNEIQ